MARASPRPEAVDRESFVSFYIRFYLPKEEAEYRLFLDQWSGVAAALKRQWERDADRLQQKTSDRASNGYQPAAAGGVPRTNTPTPSATGATAGAGAGAGARPPTAGGGTVTPRAASPPTVTIAATPSTAQPASSHATPNTAAPQPSAAPTPIPFVMPSITAF
jgi:hypothetical protein